MLSKIQHILRLPYIEQFVFRNLICGISSIGIPTHEKLPVSLTFCKIIANKLERDGFDGWIDKEVTGWLQS